MSVDIRLLGPGDAGVLDRVADDVFDGAVIDRWRREFFADSRHHIVVALDDGVVVGMVTAMHYVHPDKAPQLWINEAGVASTHLRQGIAKRMLTAMLAHGRSLGCTEAWVGTEPDNHAARALYESVRGVAEPFVGYTFELE